MTPAYAERLAARMKALADPSRLQLLALIARQPGLSIEQLTWELGTLKQASVHHHVHRLLSAGLVVRSAPRGAGKPIRLSAGGLDSLATAVRGLS